jgi:hypothetical protein
MIVYLKMFGCFGIFFLKPSFVYVGVCVVANKQGVQHWRNFPICYE